MQDAGTLTALGSLVLHAVAAPANGAAIPLDESRRGISEFLLVPYFGACIHTPPPPSNQIIHVRLPQSVRGVRSMDAVWVSGSIRAQRSDSGMGMSRYAMDAPVVEPYVEPQRQR